MNNTMRRTSGGNAVQGGSEIGPSVAGEATPWGERQRHQQVDDAAKGEWIDVQKKAFTRWCNSHLKQRGMDIKDLFEDLHDGQLLLNLLEIIGGDSVFSICKRKWNTKPKMRIHELENCNLIFEYLKAKELQLTNIGSTDLVDKNSKLILGLIWTIILRFAIAEDGKQGLLLWARRSVEGYGIDIDNFDFSWKDGRAFLALINKYRPDVLDYNATVSSDPRSNVAIAFRVAAEQLGIDQLLDVEDLVDSARPDEKSVIAYVSMFFNKFASLARKQALIDSIIKAVALTRKHDGLIFKYKYSAKQIKDWISENTARFKAADTSRSTAEVKAKIDALQDYRKETKPSQKAVLLELSSILGQLRTSQRSNSRPLFSPEEPLSDKTIEGEWNALEAAESAYEQMLIEKYAAFTVMDYEVSKVTAKLNKLEPWLESRSTCFDTTDYGNSISSAEQKLSSYEAFAAQAEVYGALLSQSQTLASSLSDEHGQVMSAKHRLQAATTLYQKIKAAGEAYKSKVEERLALERELVASTLKYGALTNEVNFVLDEVDEALTAPILGNSEDEVEAMKHTLAGVVDKFNSLAPKVDEIKAIAKTVTAHGREAALEIPVGPLVATYDKLSGSIHAREAELDKALANTKAKVQARKAFAAAAEDLNAYIQETSDASMFNNRRASLDVNAITTTLQQLKEGYKTTGKGKLAAVEEASAKQEALAVVANGFTVQTIYSLRTAFEELGKLLDARLDAHLAALAAIRSQSALSEEQWKEVNKVFSALDKDRDGSLSLKEFKDGIQGLGIVVNDSDADRQFLSLCKASPGHLTLPEFGDFMLAQLKAGSSLEDIINAFKTISGGETISQTTITTLFVKDDYADYLLTHMPAKGDGYAYVPFVHDIFKR